MFTAIKIQTKNDSNGNPRRGWLVYQNNSLAAYVDEGYLGNLALRQAFGDAVEVLFPSIDVSPGELRRLKDAAEVIA